MEIQTPTEEWSCDIEPHNQIQVVKPLMSFNQDFHNYYISHNESEIFEKRVMVVAIDNLLIDFDKYDEKFVISIYTNKYNKNIAVNFTVDMSRLGNKVEIGKHKCRIYSENKQKIIYDSRFTDWRFEK